jgi:SAM-dependent methyltransferase
LHDLTTRTTDAAFRLVRCVRCGLLRLHPQPDAEMLAAAYTSSYAPFARAGLSGWAKGSLERRAVHRLWRWFAPPRRVLDLGCARGDLLLRIRDTGNRDLVGVEPDDGAARVARARGLDVRTGTLEDAQFHEAEFATATLSHALEHVADPIDTLRELRRVIRPGGVLLLWLPNVDSIEALLLGRYWIGYDAPRHLTTFSVTTLRRALQVTGFRAIEVRHEAIGIEWAWALRLWTRERSTGVERVLATLHPLLIVLATPLALVGALSRRSGRIRVVAVAQPLRPSPDAPAFD